MFIWYAMKSLLSIENFNRNIRPYNQGMNLDWVFAGAQTQQVMPDVEPVEKVNISFLSSKTYLKFTLICGIE